MGYTAFTKDFDQVVALRDAPVARPMSGDEVAMGMAWIENAISGLDVGVPGDQPVTVLVDMSGSMMGMPIHLVASCLCALGDALHREGRDFEFLGFTTSAWKGGKSYESWLGAGKPRDPGRLNDLLHVEIKAYREDWASARAALPLLMTAGLLKENIDGEAVEWATSRMKDRAYLEGEEMGFLLVITDGVPCDNMTSGKNDVHLLDRHLDGVLAANANLEISAVCLQYKGGPEPVRWPNATIVPVHSPVEAEEMIPVMMGKIVSTMSLSETRLALRAHEPEMAI